MTGNTRSIKRLREQEQTIRQRQTKGTETKGVMRHRWNNQHRWNTLRQGRQSNRRETWLDEGCKTRQQLTTGTHGNLSNKCKNWELNKTENNWTKRQTLTLSAHCCGPACNFSVPVCHQKKSMPLFKRLKLSYNCYCLLSSTAVICLSLRTT